MIRPLMMLAAGAGAVLGLGALAKPVTFDPPRDRSTPELDAADAEVVVNNCSACHSLDYLVTQPRGKGEDFWRATVTKMITVYKAPISPEDAEAIAKTLGRKFG
jgi:mono/diheme cytochrome c family protein